MLPFPTSQKLANCRQIEYNDTMSSGSYIAEVQQRIERSFSNFSEQNKRKILLAYGLSMWPVIKLALNLENVEQEFIDAEGNIGDSFYKMFNEKVSTLQRENPDAYSKLQESLNLQTEEFFHNLELENV